MVFLEASVFNCCLNYTFKGSFTRIANVTVFVSGTFDLFNVVCKQHHRAALIPFLDGTKNDDIDSMGKQSLELTSLFTKNFLVFMT